MPSYCLFPDNQLNRGGWGEAIKQLFRCSEGVVEAVGGAVGSCKDVPALDRGKQKVGYHRGVEHCRQRFLLLSSLNIAFDELLYGCEIAANRLINFRLLNGRFVNKSSDFAPPATVPFERKVLVEAFERGGFGRSYVFKYSNFAGRNILKNRMKQVQLSGEVMVETSLADTAEGVEIMWAGRFKAIVPEQFTGCVK